MIDGAGGASILRGLFLNVISGGFVGLILRRIFIGLCCSILVACNTPRGAGLQSEVLAADGAVDANGEATYGFAVYEVSRNSIPALRSWPDLGANRLGWIKRQVQPASLIIAPGDLLSIVIWDAEENSLLTGAGQRSVNLKDTPVSARGHIFIPFVGSMNVSGMSAESARSSIEQQLISTIPSAQVQLSVTPGRANTANLVSGVSAPGVYPLPDRDYTLLSLLSEGGGVRPTFVNPQVRLFRGSKVYATSVARIYEDPDLDTTLVGGDRVIVEDDKRSFLSLGATGSEARHVFIKDNMTALDALAIAGGVSDARADPQGVLILRNYPMNAVRNDGTGPSKDRVVFTIDLTTADGLFSAGQFKLMPDDLVYATESPVNAAVTIFGLLGTALGFANRL